MAPDPAAERHRVAAAVRAAVAGVHEGRHDRRQALLAVPAADLDQVLHATFAGAADAPVTIGVGASPGAATGRAHFSADACADAVDRGEQVLLVRPETTPADMHGIQVAEGILTARGGLSSHASVTARGFGIPAVVGAEALVVEGGRATLGGVPVAEGDVLSLDGATGEVWLGARGVADVERLPELDELLAWADEVRAGHLQVRANADTGPDVAQAVAFGAEGVGLCRTEHMFLAEDRLPVVRAVLLAPTPAEEAAALEALGAAQEADFAVVLEAAGGRPVTVRLLDPPLHEFLPSADEVEREQAAGRLSPGEAGALLAAAEAWHEVNPMLGTRGVRLALLKPGLYEMQVRALLRAAVAVAARAEPGRHPVIGIMIPLTVARAELARARAAVDAVVAEAGGGLAVSVGTMVETPRAALLAGELAEVADFFSFGTNDLTQMTFGFSRDDVEARLVPAYVAAGLLPANPFETLDEAGVGALVELAVARGRATRPGLELGVCGEHGGDPASIALLHRLGVDYVSCSPFRVPVARLAAAQAILGTAPVQP